MGIVSDFFRNFFAVWTGEVPPSKNPPICTVCHIELSKFLFKQHEGYTCHECKGLWTDDNMLGLLLTASENELLDVDNEGEASDHTFYRSDPRRICPACDSKMDNYQFSYDSGIWMDACPNRHGIWLDSGELVLVRKYNNRSRQPMSSAEMQKLSEGMIKGLESSAEGLDKVNADFRSFKSQQSARNIGYRTGRSSRGF